MKKLLPAVLCLTLLMTACVRAESLTGKADGYGGELTVTVQKTGDDITGVEIISHHETQSVAGKALETIPQQILEKNSPDVDVVSGATMTSKAIMQAVRNALGTEDTASPAPTAGVSAAPDATAAQAQGLSLGFGLSTSGRVGPGKDEQGVQVYSVNEVFVSALFDADGRVRGMHIDQLEFATPNYDGDGMPQFAGFPGQGGYNWDQNHDGKIEGKTADTDEVFLSDIADWKTKRQRGDAYRMTTGTWAAQMDRFETLFIGKTVGEIDDWFKAYCSDVNGRPLKADSADEKDKAKYDALSDADKAMLADVTTAATMSLNDAHGDILTAIRMAYDARKPLADTSASTTDGIPEVATPVPVATEMPKGNG